MENNTSLILCGISLDGQMGHIPTDVLKSVLIIALLAITLISSLLPFALRRAAISHGASVRRRHIFAGIFSLLSCFGGGVFLGTCLLDLFPDTRDLISKGLAYLQIKDEFPLAEFLVAIGFFVVLFIEQVVLWFRERRDLRELDGLEDDRRRLIADGQTEGIQSPARIDHRRHTVPSSRRSNEGVLGTIASVPVTGERRQRHHSKRQVPPSGSGGHKAEARSDANVLIESPGLEVESVSGEQEPPAVSIINVSQAEEHGQSSGSVADEAAEDIEEIRTDIHFDPESHSTFRAVMLVMALSTHATFEGLALGLQTDPAQVLQIFTALCIHKCVIAFSLGMRLVQSRLTTVSIVGCCLLFCVSALVGGFIGLAITEALKSSKAAMVNGSLQGLACGTFLYITAFEILPHELNESGNRLAKLIMLLMGFALICIFVYLNPA